MAECKYCQKDYQESERTLIKNELWFANFDNHPVSPGHMKIIPKRHVISIIELTNTELISMREIMKQASELIEKEYHPDGYNYRN